MADVPQCMSAIQYLRPTHHKTFGIDCTRLIRDSHRATIIREVWTLTYTD